MQDKVQALVRLSEAERSNSRSSNQVDSLKKQNQDLTHRLTLATQEKVNALMQLAADGNASHAGKGSGPSPQKSSTWKVNPKPTFEALRSQGKRQKSHQWDVDATRHVLRDTVSGHAQFGCIVFCQSVA